MKNYMLLLMVLVLTSCGVSNSPEKVVEGYISNLFSGNISECIDVMVDTDQKPISLLPEKEVKEIEEFLKTTADYMVDGLKKENEVDELVPESFEFTKVEYNESKDQVKILCNLKFKGIDQTLDDMNFSCVKVNGEWKTVIGN